MCVCVCVCVCVCFSVLPGLAERPQLMTLWSECSGSAGLFHTTLDRVFKHMNQRYTAVLQEGHPHSADSGWTIAVFYLPNKPEGALNVTSCFHVFISVSSESLTWFVNQVFWVFLFCFVLFD